MANLGDEFELGEVVLIVSAIALVVYLVYEALSSTGQALSPLLQPLSDATQEIESQIQSIGDPNSAIATPLNDAVSSGDSFFANLGATINNWFGGSSTSGLFGSSDSSNGGDGGSY
jgi:predicted PurR-regulated permease PerM